jgi:hypothetical protein
MLANPVRHLYKWSVPDATRAKVRQTSVWNKLRANRLAASAKRLDLCAGQVAMMLHLAECTSLKGRVCLEVGSGWVLSHALIFHLLGVDRVVATDIAPIAYPQALSKAVQNAHQSHVRDMLSPFCNHNEIRERLNRLRKVQSFSFEALKDFAITYRAPIDLARDRLNTRIDFVYSFSVLEHVPVDDIPPLLNNLARMLPSGGMMIHCIHLEDHKNTAHDPFAFLSEAREDFPDNVSQDRGNRIRASEWQRIFSNVESMDSKWLYQWSRQDAKLPDSIDSSIAHQGEADLRISHLGVLSVKH